MKEKNRLPHDRPQLARAELGKSNKQEIFVKRLKGSESLTMTVYSPAPWGVMVHWSKARGRSSPHYADRARCAGCKDNLPTKELYYVYGFEVEQNRLIFLELTEKAALSIKRQLGAGETMRGIGLYVQRTPASNGRLQARVMNAHPMPNTLPADRDPEETLLRLWGIVAPTVAPKHGAEFSRNGHE